MTSLQLYLYYIWFDFVSFLISSVSLSNPSILYLLLFITTLYWRHMLPLCDTYVDMCYHK